MSPLVGAVLACLSLVGAAAVALRLAEAMGKNLSRAVCDIKAGKPQPALSRDDWLRRILPSAALAGAVMGISLPVGLALLTAWLSGLAVGRLWRRTLILSLDRTLEPAHEAETFWMFTIIALMAVQIAGLWLAVSAFLANPGHTLGIGLWLVAAFLLTRFSRNLRTRVVVALFAILGVSGYLFVSRSFMAVSRDFGVNKTLGWRFKWAGPEK